MHGSRSQALVGVTGKQIDGKGRDEQKRTKIADDIDKIYQDTKTTVDTKLAQLSTDVIAAFDSGAAIAKNLFEDYVAQRMEAYKKKRYAEWGPFGWLRWIADQFTGLPEEVNRFYEDGRDQYIITMDVVIERVAIIVATGLNDAMNEVSKGREQIKRYVASLPEDLRQIGVEAAEGIQSQFDGLQQAVQNHQDELVGLLAQKYKENLDAIDARIKELQEANKGLIQKAIDFIAGVITTIIELGKLLLQVLARVAASIGKILMDPIGFLSNLFNALKQGFQNFVKNVAKYLSQGLLGWLTGAMAGANIQMPKNLEDSQGIFGMVMGVLGITYEAIRAKAVRRLGRDGEQKASYLEQSFEMFRILATQGVVGVWQVIKDRLGDLKKMVLDPITQFLTTSVIEAGVWLLIGMMTPATGFIRACKAIYDILKFVIERAQQIIAFINSILDAVGLVADGAIEQASLKVETTLAEAIPLAIGFMASILGLGDIGQKVQAMLQKVRRPIDRAIDWVIDQGLKAYRNAGKKFNKGKVSRRLANGNKKKRSKGTKTVNNKNSRQIKKSGNHRRSVNKSSTDNRSSSHKQKLLEAASKMLKQIVKKSKTTADVDKHFPNLIRKFSLKRIEWVNLGKPTACIEFEVNPKAKIIDVNHLIHIIAPNVPAEQDQGTPVLKTDFIRYPGGSEKVGIEMSVILGPPHKDKVGTGGTPTGEALNGLFEYLPTDKNLQANKKFIKGHLLNEKLGGPGSAENLFPITAKANSLHHQIAEKDVKKSVSEGYLVFYHVKISPGLRSLDKEKSGWIDSDIETSVGVKCASGEIKVLYRGYFSSEYGKSPKFGLAKVDPSFRVNKKTNKKKKKKS